VKRCRRDDDARREGDHGEHGFATVQYVVATAFSLILLVMMANLLVDLYARGAVRDALDEGARAATVVPSGEGACVDRANEVLGSLLRGRMADDIVVECEQRGDGWIRAVARVRLRSWLPGVPDWVFTVRAVAREQS
jgi:hypothetical protein